MRPSGSRVRAYHYCVLNLWSDIRAMVCDCLPMWRSPTVHGFDAMFSVGRSRRTLDFVDTLCRIRSHARGSRPSTRGRQKQHDPGPLPSAHGCEMYRRHSLQRPECRLHLQPLKKFYPALVSTRWWSVSRVSSRWSNKVVFDFSKSAVPYFYLRRGPGSDRAEHIWRRSRTRSRTRSPSPWAPVATSWPVARPRTSSGQRMPNFGEGSARREDG